MNALFRAANRAYDDLRLNAYLRDWDVSEARDRAIDERADDLLEHDYTPFGDTVFEQLCDEFSLRDVLGDTLQHLIAGDHAAAGAVIAERLQAYARKLARDDAELRVDAEREARREGAAADDYDDREWDRHYDAPRFR